MTVFIDTNIILDVLMERDGLYQDSIAVMDFLFDNDIARFISSSSITDIYYLLRKATSCDKAKEAIGWLANAISIANVDSMDIHKALGSDVKDFEDAVIDVVAEKYGCDLIITRNVKDYRDSSVRAITPADFLAIHKAP